MKSASYGKLGSGMSVIILETWYHNYQRRYYFEDDDDAKWGQAKYRCSDRHGATLASIINATDNAFLLHMLSNERYIIRHIVCSLIVGGVQGVTVKTICKMVF